jgi:hypothetical protein
MRNTDRLKKIGFWGLHTIVWLLINIILGSLPFIITLIRGGKDDPFQVGLLCFCFTVASSGFYIFLANSQKGEQSGFARAAYMLWLAVTFVWIIGVWTIVLKLPDILPLIEDKVGVKGYVILYICSISLCLAANYRSLSVYVFKRFWTNLA